MQNGWIKIHRSLQDKGYYKDSHYVHLWVHLILEANHEGKEYLFNNKIHKLKRGQLITGRKSLSVNTGISESKIERILKFLKSEQQIEQQTSNKFRLITIKNYNCFQQNEQQSEQPVNNQWTTSEQPVNTNKNIRIKELKNKEKENIKEKEGNKKKIIEQRFIQFWNLYPNKKSKKRAMELYFSTIRKNPSLDVKIIRAVEAQIQWREKKQMRDEFVPEWKHPSTWLNQECWKDDLSEEGNQSLSDVVKERIKSYFQSTGRQPSIELLKEWQLRYGRGEKI